MRSNKAILYQAIRKIDMLCVHMLWRSQRKQFRHIGKGSSVCRCPDIIGAEYIWIGDDFFCGKDVRIEAWRRYGEKEYNPEIVIGNGVKFTDRVYLSGIHKIKIGNNVLLGRDVFISDNSHGGAVSMELSIPPVKRALTSKGPVIINDNVWIGRQVTVLSGVEIGEGSIIGANSVVRNSIPPFVIAAGSPAKIVKIID